MNENLNSPIGQAPAKLPDGPLNSEQKKESTVPAPRPPEIGIRTMESDLSSLKSSGGLGPEPKTFKPEDLVGVGTGFNPGVSPSANQQQVPAAASAAKPKSNKNLTVMAAVFAFLIIAGGIVYLFVLPIILPKPQPPVVVEPPIETPPVVSVALTHQSYFVIAPTIPAAPVSLVNLTSADVSTAVKAVSSDNQTAGILKEITFSLSGNVLESQAFLGAVLPEMDKLVIDNFEKDFTGFVYYDKNGVWPGYVYRLKQDAKIDDVKLAIKAIEKLPSLTNFYLVSPGKPKAGEFKDGALINNNPVRYFAYSLPGASLNYGWIGSNLLISTSYLGYKEAARMLSSGL
jgi:hypothetical protein